MNPTRRRMRVLAAWSMAALLTGRAFAADPMPSDEVPAAGSRPAATQAAPEPIVVRAINGRIDLHARNMDVVSALIQLRRLERRNIVVSPNVTGTVSLDLYAVTFDEALEAVLRSANLVARQDNSFTYVCTPAEAAERFLPRRTLSSRVFPLAYAGAEDVMKLLQPLLSREGKLSATMASQKGIPTNKEAAGGNEYAAADTVVAVDYPENLERMQAVVASVDVRPRQVLIEATILAASLMDDNSMGVDFTALCGIDFRSLTATSPGGQSITLGQLPEEQLDKSTTAVNSDFIAGMPKGGLKIGYVKNGVAVFIQALEQVTDTVVLANPKVLVLNKQRGEVMVGRRDGYRTTITTETTTIENVQFLETGTRLVFRPFIGSDGYVRLEIHPEDSTGGLTEAGLPFEETAEVTTNIVVRDGATIVIGGLFRDNTRTKRGQVPLLGEIPFLGTAFRRSRDEALKQEVIILLTPHIVDDPSDDKVGRQLLAETERFRVGMRQGLQWHGRERLAQAYFRAAGDHLRQGRRTLALWEANAAIGLQPTFLDAIRMREQILHKELSEPAGSAIKDMVMKRILQPPPDEGGCPAPATNEPCPEESAQSRQRPGVAATQPAVAALAKEPAKKADKS
jgi:type IV pilus assembly protein PilQ